jgi:SEC-C motif-containing protein
MLCPCGTQKEFSACCEPVLLNPDLAETAEQLMRSRYTAYVNNNITYLKETTAPEKRAQFKEEDFKEWASVEWLGLKVLSAEAKVVEFMAKYKADGQTYDHHEVSKFRQIGSRWYFVSGDSHVHAEGDHSHDHHHGHSHNHGGHHHGHQAPTVRQEAKIDRNDPCPCGSGKKYKKCHG